MKDQKKGILFGFLLALMLMGGVNMVLGSGASAASGKKAINVTYRDIKLCIDGETITPKDVNGNVVEPFLYNGTTYLPVRAVGEALGKEVKWDGATSTVYLGDVPGEAVNWVKKLPPYQVTNNDDSYYDGTGRVQSFDGSDPRNSFSVVGVKHTVGYVFSRGKGNGSYAGLNAYAIWNTNAEYKSMTFTVGSCDGTQVGGRIDVYLDGEFVNSYDLSWEKPPQTITVPLNYAASVRLQFVVAATYCAYGVYDISFAE